MPAHYGISFILLSIASFCSIASAQYADMFI